MAKRGQYITCFCGRKRWVYPYEFKKGLGKYCSQKCSNIANADKLSRARIGKNNPRFGKEPWNKGKKYSIPERQGENSHAWKGGRTREKYLLRRRSEWRQWRDAVFQRDNYTCQISRKRSNKLVPHHIKLFAFFPEDRFSVENGITLSEVEHKKLHRMSYIKQPYCDNCMKDNKKVKMEAIIVNLSLTTYRCHICGFQKTLDNKGGDVL